ncbi:DNA cytosine methyltransferase [Halobacillus litoralis]|uniref:DNA cytosine methyltransferase n=1 Tax=Halobacillus litoralis TaxID=45668 RepID=UPI001CD6E3F5|nr:DNA cytosine methyltransferase [Halobacillus litoralis]MCA1021497.1 DNA cytosine methyltransferase [Halobacillus litoralis]
MGINVISLFNGINCGRVALERAGIEVDKYYSSEINEDSIAVTTENYPDTIHIGDIEEIIKVGETNYVNESFLKGLPKIDLLIGGSPCQGISRSKSFRENLKDPRSRLFYNYVALKNWLIDNNNPELRFMLENVKPNNETKEIMDSAINAKSTMVNSALFSAQRRPRLFWTNFEIPTLPDKESSLCIKDIEYEHEYEVKEVADEYMSTIRFGKNCMSYDTSGKGYYSQANRAYYPNGKMCTIPKSRTKSKCNIHMSDNKFRRPHPIEIERLQGLPDNYTSIIKSHDTRMGLVGDGWNVDTVAHILKGIK